MLLYNVIASIDDKALSEFHWGPVVADTINLFVERDHVLTITSTGEDVRRALDSLTDDVRLMILHSEVDISRCTLQIPMGGGLVVEHEEVDSSDEGNDYTDLSMVMTTPIFIATSTAVVMILGSALFMLSTLSGHDDTDWWGVLKQIGGLINVFR